MEQQLKFNIVNQVIGAEKIDQFKQKLNTIPADLNKVNQGSQNLKGQLLGAFQNGPIAGFSAILGAIPLPLKIIAGLGAAAKEALDFAKQGEQINATNIRFERMAQNVGLVSEEIKAALDAAAKGTLDNDDALKIATTSINALGAGAKDLPQILTLSRNISKSLGSDFQQTFADISTFLEFGNKKVLKQYGLVLELKAGYDEAAKSVGLTADQLTEAQQQQVRMNILINEAGPKFSALADDITPISTNITKASVYLKNLYDDLLSFYAEFGARALIDKDDFSNVGQSRLQKQFEESSAEVDSLDRRLKQLNEERFGAKGSDQVAQYAQSIDQVSKNLRGAKAEHERLMIELSGRSDADLFRGLDASQKVAPKVKIELTSEQKSDLAEAKKKKQIEASKKYADQLKRETEAITKFVERENSQIEIERLKIELSGKSSSEIERQTAALQIRNQAEIQSVGYSKESKAAMDAATESVIKNRMELISFQDQQKASFGTGAREAFAEYLDNARDVAGQTKSLFKGAFGSIEDSLVEFTKTGELNFKKFADMIIEELTRIAIRQSVLGLVSTFGSIFAGGFSGGTPTAGGDVPTNVTTSANGNIMTGDGPMKLKKYSSGGIAKSPQFSIFGEGDLPEAYVPLPDGRSIPVKISGQAVGGGGDVYNISVSVASDGSAKTGGDANGRDIATKLAAAVKTQIMIEKRSGGLLAQ